MIFSKIKPIQAVGISEDVVKPCLKNQQVAREATSFNTTLVSECLVAIKLCSKPFNYIQNLSVSLNIIQ